MNNKNRRILIRKIIKFIKKSQLFLKNLFRLVSTVVLVLTLLIVTIPIFQLYSTVRIRLATNTLTRSMTYVKNWTRKKLVDPISRTFNSAWMRWRSFLATKYNSKLLQLALRHKSLTLVITICLISVELSLRAKILLVSYP